MPSGGINDYGRSATERGGPGGRAGRGGHGSGRCPQLQHGGGLCMAYGSQGAEETGVVPGPEAGPDDALGPLFPVGRGGVLGPERWGCGLVQGRHRLGGDRGGVQGGVFRPEQDLQPPAVRAGEMGRPGQRGGHALCPLHHQAPRRVLHVGYTLFRL